MISLARDRRVTPDTARTTAVSGPHKSGSVTEATGTPWTLSAFIGGEVGEAAESAPSRFQATGEHRPSNYETPNGDVDAKLAETRYQRDRGTQEQHRSGALFTLDLGARIVHADVLARDMQPLLRRGDRPLQGGRAQGHYLGIVRMARRPHCGVAGARIREGELGLHLPLVTQIKVNMVNMV